MRGWRISLVAVACVLATVCARAQELPQAEIGSAGALAGESDSRGTTPDANGAVSAEANAIVSESSLTGEAPALPSNFIEIYSHPVNFVLVQPQIRQVGDVTNFLFCNFQAFALFRAAL